MIFTSATFLILFLPFCVLLGHFAQNPYRKYILLVLSLVFYSWCGLRFLLLALLLATFSYGIGWLIERSHKIWIRRLFLIAGISCALGTLIYFKYFYELASWFVKWIAACTGREVSFGIRPVALPLGISFYTFSILSFFLDVYWEKHTVPRSIIDFYLYIFFFPKVIQGPILQYTDFQSQLEAAKPIPGSLNAGLEYFVKGIVKKIMIADQLAPVVQYAFDNTRGGIGTVPAWLGIGAYLLQLYYDFSGYSDMAMGLGLIMGIKLPQNFDHPYMAASVAEYWRRWHITLGAWFRDYIYTPCARILIDKNFCRHSKNRFLVCDGMCLFIVWLLTGIWHGSGLKFVVYGLWFFAFILYERLRDFYRKRRRKKRQLPARKDTRWQRLRARLLTIVAVVFGQVIFRADCLKDALLYCKTMLVWNTRDGLLFLYNIKNYTVVILLVGLIFIFPVYDKIRAAFQRNQATKAVYDLFLLCAFIVAFSYAISEGYTSFLYEVF